jgi:hypothetical protein
MTQEAEAAEELRQWVKERKVQAFEYLRHIERGTYELKHIGYKTFEEAARDAIKRAASEIEKKVVAFERKYPND